MRAQPEPGPRFPTGQQMMRSLLLLAATPLVLAGQLPRDSTISLNVQRSERVIADRASLFLLVEGNAELAPDAVARVGTKVRAILEAIRAPAFRATAEAPVMLGVGPAGPASGYQVNPMTSSFVARSAIRVQVARVDQLAAFLVAAMAAGSSGASAIAYEASAADSVRRARFPEIVATARADAEAMARALGGRLGEVVEVTMNTGGQQEGTQYLNFDGRVTQPVRAPEVAVAIWVSVRYRFVR